MLKAEIRITLKKAVSDPQGLTIKRALESLGYQDLEDVRIGKFVVIRLRCKDINSAQEQIDGMCKKLLANPIIEEYQFKIEEEGRTA
jgi:phosphoribosylformylglycinamidine synthase